MLVDMVPVQMAVHHGDDIFVLGQQRTHLAAVCYQAFMRQACKPDVARKVLVGQRMMEEDDCRLGRALQVGREPCQLLIRNGGLLLAAGRLG